MTRDSLREEAERVYLSLDDDAPASVRISCLSLLERLTPHTKTVKAPESYQENFEAFWKEWKSVTVGAKTQQVKAMGAKSYKPNEHEAIMAGLKRYANYLKANPDKRSYIPMVQTWLNQRRWEAEAAPVQLTGYKTMDDLT